MTLDAKASEADPRKPSGVSPELARWVEALAALGEDHPARIRLLREAWGQRDSLSACDLFALSDLVLDELLYLLETQAVPVHFRILVWPKLANPGEPLPGTVCPVFARLPADRTGPVGQGRADDARVRLGEQVQARYGTEVIFSPHTLGPLASIPMHESGANVFGGTGAHPKTSLSFRLSSQGMAGCFLANPAFSRSGLWARF